MADAIAERLIQSPVDGGMWWGLCSFNANYPNCLLDYPQLIGNGRCRGGVYNTESCGWEGGDCPTPSPP